MLDWVRHALSPCGGALGVASLCRSIGAAFLPRSLGAASIEQVNGCCLPAQVNRCYVLPSTGQLALHLCTSQWALCPCPSHWVLFPTQSNGRRVVASASCDAHSVARASNEQWLSMIIRQLQKNRAKSNKACSVPPHSNARSRFFVSHVDFPTKQKNGKFHNDNGGGGNPMWENNVICACKTREAAVDPTTFQSHPLKDNTPKSPVLLSALRQTCRNIIFSRLCASYSGGWSEISLLPVCVSELLRRLLCDW